MTPVSYMNNATELGSMVHHLGAMLRNVQRTNKGKPAGLVAFALENHLKALTPAHLGLTDGTPPAVPIPPAAPSMGHGRAA